jgi:hypothetical protein
MIFCSAHYAFAWFDAELCKPLIISWLRLVRGLQSPLPNRNPGRETVNSQPLTVKPADFRQEEALALSSSPAAKTNPEKSSVIGLYYYAVL